MTIYIRLDMDGQFYVEHLVNASQMAKHELSAAGVCRTLRECEPKTYRNFYQHLNTTKYTAFPVYNVLYDVIVLCIQRDIA